MYHLLVSLAFRYPVGIQYVPLPSDQIVKLQEQSIVYVYV